MSLMKNYISTFTTFRLIVKHVGGFDTLEKESWISHLIDLLAQVRATIDTF